MDRNEITVENGFSWRTLSYTDDDGNYFKLMDDYELPLDEAIDSFIEYVKTEQSKFIVEMR